MAEQEQGPATIDTGSAGAVVGPRVNEQASPQVTPAPAPAPEPAPEPKPARRRPGRPKGSRNKPKPTTPEPEDARTIRAGGYVLRNGRWELDRKE